MAIELNPYARGQLATMLAANLVHTIVRIYPSSVTMPTSAVTAAPSATGALATFSVDAVDFVANGGTLMLNSGAKNIVAGLATGTAAWFLIYNTSVSSKFIASDSIGTSGTKLLKLDNLSIVAGSPVTITSLGIKLS